MLISRPFTNQEVADRLDAFRNAGCFNREYEGLIAEACRRLRGESGSGECERPEADPQLLKAYAAWASKFAEAQGYVPTGFDAWKDSRGSNLIGLPVLDPSLLEVGK